MPRKPSSKPWLHEASGFWCATVAGKREYLDRDYRVACRKLKALRNKKKREQAGGREWLDAAFAELADEFLSDIKARKQPATYSGFRYRLRRALEILGTTLRVGEVRKFHLAKIQREMLLTERYSPTTIKDTIAAVQGVFNWAVEQEMLDSTPVAKFRKPATRRRNRVITPEEFQALLDHTDENFRRFLTALRATGCRPGEVRTLIWEWVDLGRKLWIIPKHKTVTQQRVPAPRIIPLPNSIVDMCRELAEKPHKPTDHVFLNRFGNPYNKDGICRKMARLRERAGIVAQAGEHIVLYSNRHTFGTENSANVNAFELAELMGHTDVRTTHRYTHFNVDRLHDIRRRAQGE